MFLETTSTKQWGYSFQLLRKQWKPCKKMIWLNNYIPHFYTSQLRYCVYFNYTYFLIHAQKAYLFKQTIFNHSAERNSLSIIIFMLNRIPFFWLLKTAYQYNYLYNVSTDLERVTKQNAQCSQLNSGWNLLKGTMSYQFYWFCLKWIFQQYYSSILVIS
mgnify:CR=1 FL=1